jgi:hypothetical protein
MPALVIRTDVANIYGTKAPPMPFCDLQSTDIGLHTARANSVVPSHHNCYHTWPLREWEMHEHGHTRTLQFNRQCRWMHAG